MADETDELLQELNGGRAPQAAPPAPGARAGEDIGGQWVDGAIKHGPSRDSQLTIPAPPKPSLVAAADSRHATASGGDGYRVWIVGEYFADSPDKKGKVKKPFEHEFNVPRLEGCKSLIKNRLLKQALLKKYPDFVIERTFDIVRYEALGRAPKSNSVEFMNREDLEAAAQQLRAPIRLEDYPRDDKGTADLRESLIDFMQNPDPQRVDAKGNNLVKPGDPGTFLARENARQEKRREDRELAALNPGLVV